MNDPVTPPPVSDSRAVRPSHRPIFFSGVVGVDAEWRPITHSLVAEIAAVFDGISARLTALELDRGDIVSARVYLADFADFDVMNHAWAEFFAGVTPPTRATIGAKLFPPFRVEIEFVAEVVS